MAAVKADVPDWVHVLLVGDVKRGEQISFSTQIDDQFSYWTFNDKESMDRTKQLASGDDIVGPKEMILWYPSVGSSFYYKHVATGDHFTRIELLRSILAQYQHLYADPATRDQVNEDEYILAVRPVKMSYRGETTIYQVISNFQ